MAMDELTREFLIESQEGLDRMERCLTELEERPEDAGLIGEIFRAVHTIKGTTGFLGFTRLEKLAHAGENLLGLLREGKLTADRPTVTGLLELLDGLRSILKSIETQENEGEGGDAVLIGRLEVLQAPRGAEQTGPSEMHIPARASAAAGTKPRDRAKASAAAPVLPSPTIPAPPPTAEPAAAPPPPPAPEPMTTTSYSLSGIVPFYHVWAAGRRQMRPATAWTLLSVLLCGYFCTIITRDG